LFTIAAGGWALDLPCFFPSISSVKTNLPPLEYLRLLTALRYPAFLISAYDISQASPEHRAEMEILCKQSVEQGSIILLDSGKYESYWKGDNSWTRGCFHSILARSPVPLAFSFDNQSPPDDPNAVADEVEVSVLQDQVHARGTILPIVHCGPTAVSEAAYEVARRLRPLMMAVPERILGNGVLERAKTVAAVRRALNQLDYYCPLHLLGTGNPLSILIYALSGADSFDGLEWCQTVVDHSTASLFHFQHWDFFASQTPVDELTGLPYSQKVLVHNLVFYEKWLHEVRMSLINGLGSQLLSRLLPRNAIDIIFRRLAGIL
jgi:hypothetical protein